MAVSQLASVFKLDKKGSTCAGALPKVGNAHGLLTTRRTQRVRSGRR